MVTVHKEKGYKLFDMLVNACVKKEFPFDVARIPHGKESLPASLKWGGVEHALFLFCTCYYMRGGIQSDTAINALTRMYNSKPEYFNPRFVSKNARTLKPKIQRELKRHGLGFSRSQIARFWVVNFVKLQRFWKSNPLNLYKGVESYQELCLRIIGKGKRDIDNPNGFFGFREKMVSMFTYFIISSGIIEKTFPYPVPVDFHVLRLLSAHEVLKARENGRNGLYYGMYLEEARELTKNYCIDRKVSEIDLCNALWLFSNTLCNMHPGNMSVVGERNGRKTLINPIRYNWSGRMENRYAISCAQCPIESTCAHQVPSAPYYVQGKLILRGKREKPPQLFLKGVSSTIRKKSNYIPVHLLKKIKPKVNGNGHTNGHQLDLIF